MEMEKELQTELNYFGSLLDCILDEVNVKEFVIPTPLICDGERLSLTYNGKDFKFFIGEKDVTTVNLLGIVPDLVEASLILNYQNKSKKSLINNYGNSRRQPPHHPLEPSLLSAD